MPENRSLNLFDAENKESEYIIGKVAAIFFESNETFYKVVQVKVSETSLEWNNDEIVITGNFADLIEGNDYRFEGRIVEHPKYGQQFQASNYRNETPTTRAGVIAYLSGSSFQGIGLKTATKIVDRLGTNAIQKILDDERSLAGLNLKNAQKKALLETLNSDNGMQQTIIELNSYGFGSRMSTAIFNRYREKTSDVIHENPYRLALEINGIGFKKADAIADKLNFAADSPARIQAAIFQSMHDLCHEKGDTYTTAEPLLQQALSLLMSSRRVSLNPELIADQLLQMANEGKIVGENNKIYLRSYFEAEWRIAENIKRLLKLKHKEQVDDATFKDLMVRVEDQLGISYGTDQVNAIQKALNTQLFLLTGGPGTGKTTIINGLVATFALLNDVSLDINEYKNGEFPILLAAPTGRAAKKMNESTGLPACTIHRLLGLNGNDDDIGEPQQLDGKLLIIDEMSMVDVNLFDLLLESIPNHMQLILVGDKDQLPSVGPGQVFADLLESKMIPSKELKMIYRQENKSSIIPLAHSIKEGRLPENFHINQSDRSFIDCYAAQIPSVIKQVVAKAKQRGFSKRDIQVLAPIYRGAAGIDNLNVLLQDVLNPRKSGGKEVNFKQQKFRIGDKVLHLVNSPEDNVFNGDIGEVVGIETAKESKDKKEKMIISFDGNEVSYTSKDWNKLKLAYCMSIHKAQGSEFKLVVLPLVHQYARMLKRNLLYTAITRAQNLLILLGEPSSYATCVAKVSVDRKTMIVERLHSVFQHSETKNDGKANVASESESSASPQIVPRDGAKQISKNKVLTMQLIASDQVDPLIGMEGLTPYSFNE
ncbi:RecD-like DNA helicase YrrC [Liquorilactobacillus sucicola DSM 21376 = JCM 15457]|uniref:ATP-dependent RecD2 DNA helicase n=1 Tax=Liquorilactobacillus sucicola DSM 21376 = JCM 15457 TaxID=1423806 RepID=A0A023CUS4_9LACO|nr:ATP-dependent RecD-like DNA helicase [Liquorilactobacillus sucicola]KRN05274.1 exonuclease V subunit alpha [Liquorilactobacillus sucicola DSM 21376 = JCM 15457]GAJ25336.1 RecD-like DNA helicase YrrC [Liquorilactobacillus sucicola DSM 21376 = JCM 15457]